MSQPISIMIVEDDPLISMSIEEHLIQSGYAICGKATNYESAIKIMATQSPDLVILDIDLDEQTRDGVFVAHEINRIKPVPIIFLTGLTEHYTFERAKKTNPVAYLYKPFRPNELAVQVELALSNYYHGNRSEIISTTKHIYIPNGQNKLVRINFDGLYYIRAQKAYTDLFLTQQEANTLVPKKEYDCNKPFLFSVGFGHLLSHLPDNFYKVSKSIAINLDHLNSIENQHLMVGPHEIPLLEGGKKLILTRINHIQSRKK